jgi:hypothetical protein
MEGGSFFICPVKKFFSLRRCRSDRLFFKLLMPLEASYPNQSLCVLMDLSLIDPVQAL